MHEGFEKKNTSKVISCNAVPRLAETTCRQLSTNFGTT